MTRRLSLQFDVLILPKRCHGRPAVAPPVKTADVVLTHRPHHRGRPLTNRAGPPKLASGDAIFGGWQWRHSGGAGRTEVMRDELRAE